MAISDSVMSANIISALQGKGFVASGDHSHIQVLIDEITKEVKRAITVDGVVNVTTPQGPGTGKVS